MITKVDIEYHGRGDWVYMVYRWNDIGNKWDPIQYFKPDQRKNAINYAKDLSKIPHDEICATVFLSTTSS